ncbi:MAG: hypothetical protein ACI8RY_001800 [Urechidicola sp.]|jgi:hypothetical protein
MEYTIFKYLHFSRPTSEQEVVLKAMEKFVHRENPDDFLILCGAAGTGKTSITSALVGYLNNIGKSYRIAAPTGRAARIIGRKAKVTTSTIHSLIYVPKTDVGSGKVEFKLKDGYDSTPAVYLIDEASMIPKEKDRGNTLFESEEGLLLDLIKYIKNAHVENKIIFLGDQYQLPPINEAHSYALQKDFIERTFNFSGESYLLTEVKRQEDGSYILENATDIRKAIDKGEKTHPIVGNSNETIYAAAKKFAKEQKQDGLENSVAIGVSHKANKFFNDLVRKEVFGYAKKIIEQGDLMMVTQNWHREGQQLFNGDHIEILSVDWGLQEEVAGLHFVAAKIRVLFSEEEMEVEDYLLLESITTLGGKVDPVKDNALRKQRYIKNPIFKDSNKPRDDRYVGALRLMYGNAITCNKAQGGEWNKVFINTMGIPTLKWQYTAVTRGVNDIEKF